MPEEQVIFNYRPSRVRRVIKNDFGILAAHWRIFIRPIQSSVDSTQMIVRAAAVQHNFLRQTHSAGYCPGGFVYLHDRTSKLKEEEWRQTVSNGGRANLYNDLPNVREMIET